jgi:hypothetical protein
VAAALAGIGLLLVLSMLGTSSLLWTAHRFLPERADVIDRELQRWSAVEARRAPFDWAPYRAFVRQLRDYPEAASSRTGMEAYDSESLQEVARWMNSACSFKDWSARIDVGFDNRHWPFIFGTPQGGSLRRKLLSTVMAQDYFRGGGYSSAFTRSATERRLYCIWRGDLPSLRWSAEQLKEAVDLLDRLEAARPSLRDEIEVEYLLRCRDLLQVHRSGLDPEGLLRDRKPGLRSLYCRSVMIVQMLRRLEEARVDALARASRPWEEIWPKLDFTWHASAPLPPIYGLLDQSLLRYEGEAALRRCLLRTSLAVAQYSLAAGRFPERLEDLVPHYLPALPRCPLTGVVLSYHDGTVSSPEVDDHLRSWVVGRSEPAAIR